MDYLIKAAASAWGLFLDSAPYILFGVLVAGLLRIFLNPAVVARHLGRGRFAPVFKASLLGVPVPLCSCGVLPAAAEIKKQGANNGAVASFLISTPESGVDSLAASYALLDPIMTLARPVAAFATAAVAGISENLIADPAEQPAPRPDLTCQIDGCCDGVGCDPVEHRHHHGLWQKIKFGLTYAFTDLWADLAGWFLVGLILAGLLTALIPPDFFSRYLGGGLVSMLLMLAAAVPLYVCATASTPIAAALISAGVSPGAALVFLLAGPATNLASLTVLTKLIGKRATLVYLGSIVVVSLAAGLALDQIYAWLGLNPRATVGQAAELMPLWLRWSAAFVLAAFSVGPLWRTLRGWLAKLGPKEKNAAPAASCAPT